MNPPPPTYINRGEHDELRDPRLITIYLMPPDNPGFIFP